MNCNHHLSSRFTYFGLIKLFRMSEPLYGRPSYAYIELKVEKADADDLLFINESQETSNKVVFGNNVFILDVDQGSDFMKLYAEFKRRMKRKKSAKQGDRQEIQEEESHGPSELANVRIIRNEAHGDPVVRNCDHLWYLSCLLGNL